MDGSVRTVLRGGWTGLGLGAVAGVVFAVGWVLTAVATTSTSFDLLGTAAGLVLGISIYAVPVAGVVGFVCGVVTGLIAVGTDRTLPWWAVAVAVGLWGLLWSVDPAGIIASLTRWPSIGSLVLLVGTAALHAMLLRRWRSREVLPS